MAHGLDNCSHTTVCSELGITRGNDRTNSSLVRHASVTQWSFYRPGALAVNATTKLITRTAGSDNDKLGDFRGYDHSALTPYLYDGYPSGLYYGPGGTSFTFTTIFYAEQLNVREVTGGSIPYIIIKYYPSATDRTNGTNVIKTTSTLFAESTIPVGDRPVNHTNDQTVKPASASQIINDTFLVADIPVGDIVYLDVYIGNNGGSTVYGRVGTSISDSYNEVTIYENQNPTLTGGNNYTPAPTGFTAIWPAIGSGSTPKCNDLTIDQTNGQTTYSFYLNMVGVLSAGGTSTKRVTSCTVSLKVGGVTEVIKTGQALGWTTKTLISGTIPAAISGGNFSYNEDWTVEVSSITFGTQQTAC